MTDTRSVDAMLQMEFDHEGYIEYVSGVGSSYDGFTQVAIIEIERGRWTNYQHVVIREDATGKYFRFSYGDAATEYQDDEYFGDVKEVEPYNETVVITRYREVDDAVPN